MGTLKHGFICQRFARRAKINVFSLLCSTQEAGEAIAAELFTGFSCMYQFSPKDIKAAYSDLLFSSHY